MAPTKANGKTAPLTGTGSSAGQTGKSTRVTTVEVKKTVKGNWNTRVAGNMWGNGGMERSMGSGR